MLKERKIKVLKSRDLHPVLSLVFFKQNFLHLQPRHSIRTQSQSRRSDTAAGNPRSRNMCNLKVIKALNARVSDISYPLPGEIK